MHWMGVGGWRRHKQIDHGPEGSVHAFTFQMGKQALESERDLSKGAHEGSERARI